MLVIAGLGGLFLPGCSPETEQEREYFEQRAAERQERERLAEALQGGTRHAEAIRMVQESKSTESGQTVSSWITSLQEGRTEDVLFPRWDATARGANRFRVTYTFTLMDDDYRIEKKGYKWDVDLVLNIVSGPDPMPIEQPSDRSATRTRAPQTDGEAKGQTDEELSLE